jgi:hypothetical protein
MSSRITGSLLAALLGLATSGAAQLTLNLRTGRGLLLRPEVRFDRSSLGAFDGKPDQLSFGLSAAYLH